jgi:type 1 glutamine amidotransferase
MPEAMAALAASTSSPTTHGDIPVAWTKTKYRMLYANMGHGNRIFDSKLQNRFFENAPLWLGGRLK